MVLTQAPPAPVGGGACYRLAQPQYGLHYLNVYIVGLSFLGLSQTS